MAKEAWPRASVLLGRFHLVMQPTTLGARLRALRQDAGLTLAVLAKRAGISTSYLNDIEHERTVPTLARLVDIGRVLSRSAVELLRGVRPYDG